MSSPATSYTPPVTPHSDDEVLVRVEGVSKKFCRSLKKSLWYGVCDIGAELNPFRRRVAEVAGSELRVAREEAEVAGSELLVASEEGRVAGKELRVTSENQSASGPATRHQSPVTPEASLRDGEFFAVKDVSFELRRGELRTPGRSEKEISKKCLGATKVPDSGRRRHQCLGLIGHNGAGKTTLLKMLNGLIKPDRGTITMRGRVGALIALGAGFNPILTGREPKGWEARRTSNRRLAQRVQRRGEGANQNIYINGSVLGLTKKEPERRAARRKGAEGRPGGLRG
jgi:hypothetical protein